MATLILIALRDFWEITASVQSMVFIIVSVVNTYKDTLMSFVFVIIIAKFLTLRGLKL